VRYTVIGSQGFIGSHLVQYLRAAGHDCLTPPRDYREVIDEALGHVVYCVGVTADFRRRPMDTVEAHVCHLLPLLRSGRFETLLYLSSTRIYASSGRPDAELIVDPANPDHLYNVSKMMGEAICLSARPETCRVVRLSNVFGSDLHSDNFLSSIVRAALEAGRVDLSTDLNSERDYLDVYDAVGALAEIATRGRQRIYNLAFGSNRTTAQLVDVLRRETGCEVNVPPGAPTVRFPQIDIAAVRTEFGFRPRDVLAALPDLVQKFRMGLTHNDSN